MVFYTELKEYEGIEHTLEDAPPSLGEYVGAVSQDIWNSNPTTSAIRAYELSQSIVGSYDIDDSGGGLPSITHTPPKTRELSMEDQAAHIKDMGLDGKVKPTQGYTREALDIVTSRKFEENAIKETRESAPMRYAPLGLAAGLGVAMADPVNIASAFFPVVGEARAMQLLRGASGAWGRAGVRAGIGAVEGAVGTAVLEPALYAAKTFEQADYDMTDSLMNIGFGAVFGAAMQSAGGTAGEFLNARRGVRNAWEVAPVTDATEKMRSAFADEMYTALVKANPEMDRSVADASAALLDARARTWSHDMGRPAEEYYARYKPDFADAAQESGETLQQAMYRSKAQNISDFIDESGHIPKNEKQSVYVFGDVRREDAGIPASSLELDSDTVRHIKNRHPDFSEWDKIVDVVNSGDVFEISPDTKTKYPGRAFALETENGVHVVLGYIKSGKHGDRFVIGTTFRDSKAAFEHWLKQNNAAAIYQSAGGSPAQPKPAKTGRVSDLNSGNMSASNIDQSTAPVNGIESTPEEIMQFFGSDNPRASVTFEEEGKAVIRFFGSVDPTSAPHELYHIFRRELAETAADASAPERVREDWRAIEEFAESRPGEAWDVFQEERFAKAGEKFLLEGVAPTPALQRVFERLKQWFSEVYTQAEAAGIPISDEMRKVFSNMMSMEDADTAFRYALGDMHSRNVAKEFAGGDESAVLDVDTTNVNAVRAVVDDSAAVLQGHMKGVALADPELAASIAKEFDPALQQADAEIARTATYREVLHEAALCETRR